MDISKAKLKKAASKLGERNLAYLELQSQAALAAASETGPVYFSNSGIIDSYTVISTRSIRRSAAVRRTAMLAAVLALLLGMTVVANGTVRQMTLDFVRRVFVERDSVSYEFHEGDNEEVTELPELNFAIPEGFEYVNGFTNEVNASWHYKNKELGKTITIGVALLSSDTEISFEWDTKNRKTVYINGIEADFYPAGERSNQNSILWIDNNLGLVVAISSTLSETEIVKIAESIYIKK